MNRCATIARTVVACAIAATMSPASAGYFEDRNWRRLVDFTPRDIDDLSAREQARLRAASQVGLIQHCGGSLTAVLVEIDGKPYVFTNRHGAISIKTEEIYCPTEEYRQTLRYLPDWGLNRYQPERADRSVALKWPPHNLGRTRYESGNLSTARVANDWLVFEIAGGQRDLRQDELPFRVGGKAMRRGAMPLPSYDYALDARIAAGTFFGFSSDYDGMRSVFSQDCEMDQGSVELHGLLLFVVNHQCDTLPGSSGSPLTIYEAESRAFVIVGLNARGPNHHDDQSWPLRQANRGPQIYAMLERLPFVQSKDYPSLRDMNDWPESKAWPPPLPAPPDERIWDRLARSKDGKHINIRAGLGTEFAVKGQLTPDHFMTLRQCVGQWCEVAGEVAVDGLTKYVEGFVYKPLIDVFPVTADTRRPYHFKGGEKVVVIGEGRAKLYPGDVQGDFSKPGTDESFKMSNGYAYEQRVDQWTTESDLSLSKSFHSIDPGHVLFVRECTVSWCSVYGKVRGFDDDYVRRGTRHALIEQRKTRHDAPRNSATTIKAVQETLVIHKSRIALPPEAALTSAAKKEVDHPTYKIHRLLQEAGCYSGKPDDDWGSASRKALADFNEQLIWAIPRTEPSRELFEALEVMAPSVECD